MMSAAILLTAVGEQMKVRPDAVDQGEPEGASFASSLIERVDDSELGLGKSIPVVPSMPALQLKNKAGTKTEQNQNAPAEMKAGLKESAVAAQRVSISKIPKGLSVKNAHAPVPPTTVVQQAKAGETVSGAEQVDLPGDMASSTAPPSPAALSTASSEGNVPRPGTAESDSSLVSNGDGLSATQRAMEAVGSPKEVVPTKVSTKIQKSEATQKISPKAVVAGVSANSIEPEPGADDVTVAIVAVAVQSPASVVIPRSEADSAAIQRTGENGLAGVGFGAGVIQGSINGPDRPEVVGGAKVNVSDDAATSTGAEVLHASPKMLAAGDKAVAAPLVPQESGRDRTLLTTVERPVVASHSAVEVVGTVTTVVPGVVVAGNPLERGTAAAGLPAAETSGDSAGVPVASREQAMSGIVTATLEGAPQMLTATPTSLEVGIQNGTHGWLRVRAEMTDGGSVSASVSAVTPAGQEMLHRELPSLTAYLHEEKVAVNTVVVHALSPVEAEPRSSVGMDSTGGQTAQRGSEGDERQRYAKSGIPDAAEDAMTYRSWQGDDEDGSLQLATYATGGSWLSVRA